MRIHDVTNYAFRLIGSQTSATSYTYITQEAGRRGRMRLNSAMVHGRMCCSGELFDSGLDTMSNVESMSCSEVVPT